MQKLPMHKRNEISKQIDGMLEDGVISPSDSPWASPIVIVTKKTGESRLCIDYRRLNEVTEKDAYLLPHINDAIESMAGATYFSVIDLKSGFWQLPVKKEDRPKTAFTCPDGLFEFNTMPFGLISAPASFQRAMDKVLKDLQGKICFVYMDDTIVFSPSWEKHLEDISTVLTRFREAKLQVNLEKCQWGLREVSYLGHTLSRNGVHTDPKKIEEVRVWNPSQDVKQVREFLGMASYYRRFVKDFAKIAQPLHKLTGKGTPFQWDEKCQEAFDELKKRLISAPILAMPDFGDKAAEFILDCDASNYAVGSVLSQRQKDGSERPVAYASKAMNRGQKNYEATKREMLALVTFIKEFRPYLLGKKFKVRTDHQALAWLRSFRDPQGIVARWVQALEEYDFTCEYRKGTKHGNADALSRYGIDENTPKIEDTVHEINAAWTPGSRREEIASETRNDPDLAQVVAWINNRSSRPTTQQLRNKHKQVKMLVQQWERLVLDNGILYLHLAGTPRLLIPPTLMRQLFIHEAHTGRGAAHFGRQKTYDAVKDRFWWPEMRKDVQEYMDACEICAAIKPPTITPRAPMQPMVFGRPMECVERDVVGPLPTTARGNKYILTMIDVFTKWVKATPIPDQQTRTIAEVFIKQWICRHGVPLTLHSDQGSNFSSELFTELCRLLRMNKTRTTPFHPQGNGAVERFHRTLRQSLLAHTEYERMNWDTTLPWCLWAYRSITHNSTNHSPAAALYGRELRLPLDFELGPTEGGSEEVSQYMSHFLDTIRKTWNTIENFANVQHDKQKIQYDKRVAGIHHFKEGDEVFLHEPAVPRGQCRKLTRPWSGPWIVVRELGESTYQIRWKESRRKYLTVHANRLKPFRLGVHPEEPVEPVPLQPNETPL